VLDPKETTVIVNPAAGSGRVGRAWASLQPQLREALGEVDFRVSARPGEAEEAARLAVLEGQRTILSLGGDGTHNEVVNGIMATSPAPGAIALGVLPAGTGSDFARMLKAPRSPVEAALALREAPSGPLDLGWVRIGSGASCRSRYFVNVATFGMSGLIGALVKESSSALGGTLSYYLAAVRGLLRYRPARVRLVADGELLGEYEINTVALANARYFGGGMRIAPDADLADGWLDGTILEQRSFWRMLSLSLAIYRGRHTEADFVHTFRARSVEARLVGGVPASLDLDGEASGMIPATFEVVPGALRLLGARRG
jgi:YegS/Rv2252/BmrU family lipid kinase